MSTARKYKTKYFAKSILLYSVISACLILSAKVIFAQDNTERSIIISPPTFTESFNPGDRKEGKMKITNTSPNDTITFKAVMRDFIVEDTIGTPLINVNLDTVKSKFAASSWVAIYPSTFTLAPGKTQEINYYVQVPIDARPGGRYAAVVYEPLTRINIEGTGTGVETHIGSLFIFRINGPIVENATVTRFAPEKAMWEYGPVTINTQILNSSDSHIKPTGTVAIKNFFGQIVATQPLSEYNIFPEARRDFQNTLGKKYMFGPYTAELKATYGDAGTKTLFATVGFFVLPWKIASLVLLAIVVVVLLIIFYRRNKKKNSPPPPPHTEAQQPVATQ
jgi:hypothetical protein